MLYGNIFLLHLNYLAQIDAFLRYKSGATSAITRTASNQFVQLFSRGSGLWYIYQRCQRLQIYRCQVNTYFIAKMIGDFSMHFKLCFKLINISNIINAF